MKVNENENLKQSRPKRVSGDKIVISKNRVSKVVDELADATSKYAAVHRLSVKFGFRAPAVLSYETATKTLNLERLFHLTSLREVYLEAMTSKNFVEADGCFFEAGKVLSILHANLENEEVVAWRAPQSFLRNLRRYGLEAGPESKWQNAIIHGDFGYSNIFLNSDKHTVVLDPSPDGIVTKHHWESGPVYIDLGRMLACLEGAALPLLQTISLNYAIVRRVQSAFLDGYRSVSKFDLDHATAFAFGYAIVREQSKQAKWIASVTKPALRYNRMVRRNFPLSRKLKFYGS